jgi:hypothetical protein
VNEPPHCHDRDVVALAMKACLSERDRLELVRYFLLDRVERAVLEEEDGVVVVDRRPEQTAHVGRRGREDDLEPGHVHEPGLELLRMLGPGAPPGATLRPDRQRHLDLPPRHVAVLCGLVDDLLHGQRREILVHDLHHRAHALHGNADARAHDGQLRDRRVANPLRPELVEHPLRDAHRAAHLGDVLAHDEDVVVLAHRPLERVSHRLAVGELRHGSGALSSRVRA